MSGATQHFQAKISERGERIGRTKERSESEKERKTKRKNEEKLLSLKSSEKLKHEGKIRWEGKWDDQGEGKKGRAREERGGEGGREKEN